MVGRAHARKVRFLGICSAISLLAFFLATASSDAWAQQTSYAKSKDSRNIKYDIGFTDESGRRRQLSFGLERWQVKRSLDDMPSVHALSRDLERHAREVTKSINTELENKHSELMDETLVQLRQRAEMWNAQLPPGFAFRIEKRGNHWQISFDPDRNQRFTEAEHDRLTRLAKKGMNDLSAYSARLRKQAERTLRSELRTKEAGAKDDLERQRRALLDEGYLMLEKDGRYVSINYGKVVDDYVIAMRPLAKAILRQEPDTRKAIALALAFFQNIPYDTLLNRRDATGFVSPAALIELNKGDCDTKAAALVATIKAMRRNVGTAIVLVPGHAAVAIDLPARPGDRTTRIKGRTYILAEPAGPGLFPLGDASFETRAAISKKQISRAFLFD